MINSGKRYRTKKERMRVERDGPPLLADGSLDYTESMARLFKEYQHITDDLLTSGRSILRALSVRSGTTLPTSLGASLRSIVTCAPHFFRPIIITNPPTTATFKFHFPICNINSYKPSSTGTAIFASWESWETATSATSLGHLSKCVAERQGERRRTGISLGAARVADATRTTCH